MRLIILTTTSTIYLAWIICFFFCFICLKLVSCLTFFFCLFVCFWHTVSHIKSNQHIVFSLLLLCLCVCLFTNKYKIIVKLVMLWLFFFGLTTENNFFFSFSFTVFILLFFFYSLTTNQFDRIISFYCILFYWSVNIIDDSID